MPYLPKQNEIWDGCKVFARLSGPSKLVIHPEPKEGVQPKKEVGDISALRTMELFIFVLTGDYMWRDRIIAVKEVFQATGKGDDKDPQGTKKQRSHLNQTIDKLKTGRTTKRVEHRFPIFGDGQFVGLYRSAADSDVHRFRQLVIAAREETNPEQKILWFREGLRQIVDRRALDLRPAPIMANYQNLWPFTQKLDLEIRAEFNRAREELHEAHRLRTQPNSKFEREVRAFICLTGLTLDAFSPVDSLIRNVLDALFAGKVAELSVGDADLIIEKMNVALASSQFLRTRLDYSRELIGCGSPEISFVSVISGMPVVDATRLRDLYLGTDDLAALGSAATPEPPSLVVEVQGTTNLNMEVRIKFPPEPENLIRNDAQRRDLIVKLLEQLGVSDPDDHLIEIWIKKVSEGCTEISVEASASLAAAILRAFQEGRLAGLGVENVIVTTGGIRPQLASFPVAPSSASKIVEQLGNAYWRMVVVRPFTRLRCLYSLKPWHSPLASTIAATDYRAYASVVSNAGVRRSRRVDALIAFVVWPILCGAVLAIVLTALEVVFPELHVSVWKGVLSGLLLSVMGAQVCSTAISPLSCGSGGIALGLAFGFAQAMIFGAASATTPIYNWSTNIKADPFSAIVGGPVGLTAPQWLTGLNNTGWFSTWTSLIILLPIVLAIGISAWQMGQPRIAAGGHSNWPDDEIGGNRREKPRVLVPAVLGSFAGAGIGLTLLVTICLSLVVPFGQNSRFVAFAVAFALLGGLAFGVATALRTGWRYAAVIGGLIHAAIAMGLCLLLAYVSGSFWPGLVLSAATAFFHSTYFTLAFVIGERLGSVRAAVWAAALEGVLGFSGFVLWRLIHG